MLMVKAGKPVDDFIEQIIPHLQKGDIIIDGGNSHFPDTIRRTNTWSQRDFFLLVPEFRAEKRGRSTDLRSCREVLRQHGLL